MDSTLNTIREIDKSLTAFSIKCDVQDLSKHISINKNGLTVVSQNIRSIYRNLDDFQITLTDLHFDIDVLILTECRLSDKPIPELVNYNSFATNYNTNQNDGVTAYVKKNLKASVKEIKLSHATCLQVNVLNSVVLGIYRSPSKSDASEFINSLSSHLNSLKTYTKIIITGDININLIPKENEQSTELSNRANYLNMLAMYGILPGHVHPTRENSCLDHFMMKINKAKHTAYVAILNTTVTDHCAIFLCLSKSKREYSCSKTSVVTDYEQAYNKLLKSNLLTLLLSEDPDHIVRQLTDKINKSLEKSRKIKYLPKSKRTIKPWITSGILRCIRNRNKMQLKLKSDPHNQILKISYKRYRNFCNNLIKKLKRKYESNQITKSAKNPRALWNTIKNITHLKGRDTTNTDLLNIKTTPEESVQYVNHFFANIGKHLADKIRPPFQSSHQNLETNPHRSSFVLLDTDPEEIGDIIMSLKSGSAPGWDNIPTLFLKRAKNILSPIISHLANVCFRTGKFPDYLKKSIVTPVYKSGKRDDVNNYRPISVLTSISKVIEKIINARLINYLNKYKIISNSQFGFRRGVSTEDAICALSSRVTELLDQGQKCLAVFLDLKKAFDTVSLSILIQKLEYIGVRGLPLELFKSYLYGRSQRVKIAENVSGDSEVTFGVPQGSVLGPTLFLIYINALTNMRIKGGLIFSYADDTAIVFSNSSWESVYNIAETGLSTVYAWLKNNRLTLNVNKTNYICFSINKRTEPSNDYTLKIHQCNHTEHCDCDAITRVTSTKYLGVVIDKRLSWHSQIDSVSERIRKLIWIFKTLRHLTAPKLLDQIYISLAQSVLAYCLPIWGGATKLKFLTVERAQRCLLKVMYFKPYRFPTQELYTQSNILSVRKLYILLSVLKVHKKLTFDPNLISGRRRCNVATTHKCNTKFAKRQFLAQSSILYNQIDKKLELYKLLTKNCKTKIINWIKTLNYHQNEALLTRVSS